MLLKVNLINCNLLRTLVTNVLYFPFRRKSTTLVICTKIQIGSAALVLLFLHFGVGEPSLIVLCKVFLLFNIRVIDSGWGRRGEFPGFIFLCVSFSLFAVALRRLLGLLSHLRW